jgi:hypothetical protein
MGYHVRTKVWLLDVSSGYSPIADVQGVICAPQAHTKNKKAGGGEMAMVLQNAFRDNNMGFGNVPERMNLLFERRAYFSATINF